MVHVLGAPFSVAAGVLAWAGLVKFLRPSPAGRALRQARLPAARWAVRILGVVEMAVGGACLAHPVAGAEAALAGLYAGFAAFLIFALRTGGPAASCGCLGRRDAAPSWFHVTLNLLAAGVGGSLVVARATVPPVLSQAGATPFAGLPYLVGLVTAAVLGVLAVAHAPTMVLAWRPAAEGP